MRFQWLWQITTTFTRQQKCLLQQCFLVAAVRRNSLFFRKSPRFLKVLTTQEPSARNTHTPVCTASLLKVPACTVDSTSSFSEAVADGNYFDFHVPPWLFWLALNTISLWPFGCVLMIVMAWMQHINSQEHGVNFKYGPWPVSHMKVVKRGKKQMSPSCGFKTHSFWCHLSTAPADIRLHKHKGGVHAAGCLSSRRNLFTLLPHPGVVHNKTLQGCVWWLAGVPGDHVCAYVCFK